MEEKKKISDILNEYKSLYDSGVISKEEYEEKKETLLNELNSQSEQVSEKENKEETIVPKRGFSNVFVIAICVGALLLAGSAVFSIVSLFSGNKKQNEVLEKDEIRFGSYPQEYIPQFDGTKSNEGLLKSLEKQLYKNVEGLPEGKDKDNGWSPLRFNDLVEEFDTSTFNTVKKVVEGDYSWYKDFKYNDQHYRAIYYTKYRSASPFSPTTTMVPGPREGDFYANIIHYFKFKPIVWRKLETKANGYTYLMSSKILDYHEFEPRTLDILDLEKPKPNNYKVSSIRNWLNDHFFKSAFSQTNVSKMEQMNVDNSLASTTDETNDFVCEDTVDYVTLLSKKDFTNPDYNLLVEKRRELKTTTYASSFMFANVDTNTNTTTYTKGKECYWLRTPSNDNSAGTRATLGNYGGLSVSADSTYWCDCGVVPVISVKL